MIDTFHHLSPPSTLTHPPSLRTSLPPLSPPSPHPFSLSNLSPYRSEARLLCPSPCRSVMRAETQYLPHFEGKQQIYYRNKGRIILH